MDEVKDGISMLGDNVNKIAEITQERKKEHEKVTEAQLEISRNQLKVTEVQLKTAKEQKEVKLLEAYNSLLMNAIFIVMYLHVFNIRFFWRVISTPV
jgi:hypothetical protein